MKANVVAAAFHELIGFRDKLREMLFGFVGVGFSFVLEMRVLNLCSGTGSVSRPFREARWEVVEVDWDATHNPTHGVDLMTWDCPYEAGHFDVVWASPDCTQYRRARARARTP